MVSLANINIQNIDAATIITLFFLILIGYMLFLYHKQGHLKTENQDYITRLQKANEEIGKLREAYERVVKDLDISQKRNIDLMDFINTFRDNIQFTHGGHNNDQRD